MTDVPVRNLRRWAGALASIPMQVPPLALRMDGLWLEYKTTSLFTSNGKSFYDFGMLATFQNIAIEPGHARPVLVWATAWKVPSYYYTYGVDLDLSNLSFPLNFGFNNKTGAVLQWSGIAVNWSWSTKILWVDAIENQDFRLNPFQFPGDSGAAVNNWAFYYDVSGDTFTNRVAFRLNGNNHNPWLTVLGDMMWSFSLPNGAGAFMLIIQFDEDWFIIPDTYLPQWAIPVCGIPAQNNSWGTWTYGVDRWDVLDMAVIAVWPGDFIGSWADEAEILASFVELPEWCRAFINDVPAVRYWATWIYMPAAGGSWDNNYYIYKSATPSGRLYDQWANLQIDADAEQWVKNIFVGSDWSPNTLTGDGEIYNMKNMILESYVVSSTDIVAAIDAARGVSNDCQVSLPKSLKNVSMSFQNNNASVSPFWIFKNVTDWYPNIELRGRSSINFGGTQWVFQIWDSGASCNMTIRLYDNSALGNSWSYGMTLYDNTSRLDVHLYDNAQLAASCINPNTSLAGPIPARWSIFIHVHSPYVKIDSSYMTNDAYTIVYYWYYKNFGSIASLAQITDTITGATWDDTLKQATFTGTFSGLSIGDWVEVSGVSPSWYNILAQIVNFASMTDMVLQFPTVWSDPGTYTSGWSWVIKKVVKLWRNINIPGTVAAIPTGAWFTWRMYAEVAANTNVKKIKLIAYNRQTGDIATLYENTDIDSVIWDDIKMWVDWSVQNQNIILSPAEAKETQIASTPSTTIRGDLYPSSLSLTNVYILLVIDTISANDIIVYTLSTSPM